MMKSEGLFEWQRGPIIFSQPRYMFATHTVVLLCIDAMLLNAINFWIPLSLQIEY
jgi:hypothetical protein